MQIAIAIVGALGLVWLVIALWLFFWAENSGRFQGLTFLAILFYAALYILALAK